MSNVNEKKTIRKYGRGACAEAFVQHSAGDGARSVADHFGVTTNAADAMINAGRYLHSLEPPKPATMMKTIFVIFSLDWSDVVTDVSLTTGTKRMNTITFMDEHRTEDEAEHIQQLRDRVKANPDTEFTTMKVYREAVN